ncbi:hypothetical protein [Streptomyces sp. NPDC020742]|uniref:hypothetical protein n=1 Tax=Streptomyces sp. NPDC020742 TaxID=3154897 RepID=UPI0033F90B8D
MGIESEQLVFDYLSRVGDLAQQRGLPAAARMRLVTRLRAELDGQQADSVSGVRKKLARLGTPEAVVAAEGGAPPPGQPEADAAPPARRPTTLGKLAGLDRLAGRDKLAGLDKHTALDKLTGLARRRGPAAAPPTGPVVPLDGASSGNGGRIPGPRPGGTESGPPSVGLPPHLAGADELGDADEAPDWWRVEPAPFGAGESVPGFVGGIEIPEMWKRPGGADETDEENAEGEEGGATGAAEGGGPGSKAGRGRRGVLGPLLLRKRGPDAGAAEDALPPASAKAADTVGGTDGAVVEGAVRGVPLRAWLRPVPTLAVLLLLAGAVLGSWLALAGGWALAYVSRTLTRTEAKFAALGVPGTVAGGMVVWLWGRFDGRWGEPIAQGRLGQELLDGLPIMARVAAVASALYLVWRMRRTVR